MGRGRSFFSMKEEKDLLRGGTVEEALLDDDGGPFSRLFRLLLRLWLESLILVFFLMLLLDKGEFEVTSVVL